MKKTNIICREILEKCLINRKQKFIGRDLARLLSVSPDTVSSALAPLKSIGAISMYPRHFEVINFKKALLFFSVNRQLSKDMAYSTYADVKSISSIEDRLPEGIAYTNYSGYTKNFSNDAAAYGEVYVYATEFALDEIKKRFPKSAVSRRSEYKNLFVMNADYVLEKKIMGNNLIHSSVSLPQLYADLWNTESWYAYEFLKKLEKKIDDAYANAVLD